PVRLPRRGDLQHCVGALRGVRSSVVVSFRRDAGGGASADLRLPGDGGGALWGALSRSRPKARAGLADRGRGTHRQGAGADRARGAARFGRVATGDAGAVPDERLHLVGAVWAVPLGRLALVSG